MKLAFLTNRIDKPSARYRFIQYIPYLEKQGLRVEVFKIPSSFLKRAAFFKTLGAFDCVFLQRKLLSFLDWRIFRKNAKSVVYDFDDAVMFRDSKSKRPESFFRMLMFKRTIHGSDAVISGNKYLYEYASRHNKRVFTIPTVIDMARYGEKNYAPDSGVVTLGWIGSGITLFYLEEMKDALDEVFERHPFTRLKIVADKFFDCAKMPVIKKKWNYEEEIADLHSFDIGLMPLIDDPWSRGKCGFKLLQYMAVGVPGVASKVGVNSEIVTHGINGFLANGTKEWVDCLSKLIEDAALRERLGQEARKTVKERYSLEVNAPKLKKIIENTAEKITETKIK
ncbi:MAG: glycosyltransferase family 4 protein [Thermodesulfobacteriota bacterium]